MARVQCHPNMAAFLKTITRSELGPLVDDPATDEGYKVIVGSRPGHLILMDSYEHHPMKVVEIRKDLKSTAAGAYQLLGRYYEPYRAKLGLKDFSPESQDYIAMQQIRECRATENIIAGQFEEAVERCAHIWASLPGAGYGQHENAVEHLLAFYLQEGGKVA